MPSVFRKSNILNEVVVASDGAEALGYLFETGGFEFLAMTSRWSYTVPNLSGTGGFEFLFS